MAKIQAIVVLAGMLLVATFLVDRTACFVTRAKREELKVGPSACEIVKRRINISIVEFAYLASVKCNFLGNEFE